MYRLGFALLILAFVSVSAQAQEGSLCLAIQGIPSAEVSHPGIMLAFVGAIRQIPPPVPVYVCEVPDPKYGPVAMTKMVNDGKGGIFAAIIMVARSAPDRYTEESLQTILEHEIAHLITESSSPCGVVSGNKLRSMEWQLACEVPADALVAQKVGAEPVRVMLREVEKERIPFLKPPLQDYTRREIAGRIAALKDK